MALFILYRAVERDRNPAGIHAVLVNAADEATARTLANQKAPMPPGAYLSGTVQEKAVPDSWVAYPVSSLLANQLIWFEGDAVSLTGMTRGGNRMSIG